MSVQLQRESLREQNVIFIQRKSNIICNKMSFNIKNITVAMRFVEKGYYHITMHNYQIKHIIQL